MERTVEKREKGITLVALVITIIVLLILAGVTISLVVGDNGVIGKAKEAKIEMRGASVEERRDLWMTEVKMIGHTDGTAKTMDQILEEIKNLGLLTEEEVAKIKAPENVNHEITIGSRTISFKVEMPEENIPETPIEELVKKEKIKVGDYINYTSGTGIYNVPASKSGYSVGEQNYDISKYSGGWQVIYLNKESGVIDIISSKNVLEGNTNNTVYFGTKTGYNNFVSVLNEMASKYINPSYATKARSVGTNRTNPEGTTAFCSDANYPYLADVLENDDNYRADYFTITSNSRIENASDYWVGSRFIGFNTTSAMLSGVYIKADQNGATEPMMSLYNNEPSEATYYWGSHGIRPIITLKTGIIVDTSDDIHNGSSLENAWRLK